MSELHWLPPASTRLLRAGLAALLLAACSSNPVIPAAVSEAHVAAAAGTSSAAGAGASTAAGAGASTAAASGSGATAADGLPTLRPQIRERYRALEASASGTSWQLDPAESDIRIYAFRAGAAARFGHNHVLSVPHFTGQAWAPSKGGLHGASLDLGFRLSELAVDPPALRRETAGGFAGELDPDAIRGTLEHLLGDQGFQASSFPWVEVSASVESGELPVAIADVALTVHGETHHQRLALKVQADTRHIEIRGQLAFRQGDFGIKPYAVMGGLLAVDDLVMVEFVLRGKPAHL